MIPFNLTYEDGIDGCPFVSTLSNTNGTVYNNDCCWPNTPSIRYEEPSEFTIDSVTIESKPKLKIDLQFWHQSDCLVSTHYLEWKLYDVQRDGSGDPILPYTADTDIMTISFMLFVDPELSTTAPCYPCFNGLNVL